MVSHPDLFHSPNKMQPPGRELISDGTELDMCHQQIGVPHVGLFKSLSMSTVNSPPRRMALNNNFSLTWEAFFKLGKY